MDRSFAARLGRPLPVPSLAHGLRSHLPVRLFSRRTLLIVLAGIVLLTGGWLWLRNSPLVSVEHVRVSGLRGPEAASIEAALSKEAMQMSTMNVDVGALRASVARFHLVRDLQVSTSFPHGLHITVREQLPVAVLVSDGVRTAVAADGVVLGPALASKSLAVLHATVDPLPGRRVTEAPLLASLKVLGAAPPALRRLVDHLYTGPQGLTVAMRNGLLAYFGDASRPHAKWVSLALVLADPSSLDASYVDVRLPERPAAGVPASAEGSSTSTEVSATDPTAAALAATLAEAVSGAPPVTTSEPSESSTGSTEAPAGSSETPVETTVETAAPAPIEAEGTVPPIGG